jgi:Recombination endonuclease VII
LVCLRCKLDQPRDQFSEGSLTGHMRVCRTCREQGKQTRGTANARIKGAKNSRDYHFRDRYGITAVEVDAMIEAQGGLCALCKERPAEQVDHDHKTGKVRAILCLLCNAGIGAFKDDPEIIRNAIKYLERNDGFAPMP